MLLYVSPVEHSLSLSLSLTGIQIVLIYRVPSGALSLSLVYRSCYYTCPQWSTLFSLSHWLTDHATIRVPSGALSLSHWYTDRATIRVPCGTLSLSLSHWYTDRAHISCPQWSTLSLSLVYRSCYYTCPLWSTLSLTSIQIMLLYVSPVEHSLSLSLVYRSCYYTCPQWSTLSLSHWYTDCAHISCPHLSTLSFSSIQIMSMEHSLSLSLI